VLLWLVFVASICVLGGVLVAAAVDVKVDGRAVGESSGAWACAFGLEVGGIVLSGVRARGTALRLNVHLGGLRIPVWGAKAGAEVAEEPGEKSAPASRKRASRGSSFRRWLSVEDALDLLLGDRFLSLEELALHLDYGFSDVVLTGRCAGVLYALSGALPDPIRLSHQPRWDGAERWEVTLKGQASIWIGRVLARALWAMLRRRTRWSRVTPRGPANPQASSTDLA
jgi:hypothetical protein